MDDLDIFNLEQAGVSAEDLTPHPDIHTLFVHYSKLYFQDALGACSVQWSSSRMTRCAGTCAFAKGAGCIIKLSEPLLKLRTADDLKETLLHEMIHAYIQLQRVPGAGPDGHGPPFVAKMTAINTSTAPDFHRPARGYNITVCHTWHDEVRHYQTHWWQCDRCGNEVKRAMNRPPQPADCRGRKGRGDDCKDDRCLWHTHLRRCGGTYIKTKEPEPKKKAPRKRKGAAQGDAAATPSKRGALDQVAGAGKFPGQPRFAASGSEHGGAALAAPITAFFKPATPPRPSAGAAACASSAAGAPDGDDATGGVHARPFAPQSAAAPRDIGAAASGGTAVDVVDLTDPPASFLGAMSWGQPTPPPKRKRQLPPPLPPALPSGDGPASSQRVSSGRDAAAAGPSLPAAFAAFRDGERPAAKRARLGVPEPSTWTPEAAARVRGSAGDAAAHASSSSGSSQQTVSVSRGGHSSSAARGVVGGSSDGDLGEGAAAGGPAPPGRELAAVQPGLAALQIGGSSDVICIDDDSDSPCDADSGALPGAAGGGLGMQARREAGDVDAATRRAACAAAALRRLSVAAP